MSACRRMQIDSYLSPCPKLKPKWIKDLNINPDTLNLIEENVGKSVEHIGTGHNFLNRTPITKAPRLTIIKCDLMELKNLCKVNDTVYRIIWLPTEWKMIFTNLTSDRGLISKIYKALRKVDIKKSNNPI